MNDLSPQTRKLIDMAREGDRLPPGRRARLESKFFARVASGALASLVARDAWAGTAAASGWFGPVAKGIAGVALISSLGAGGYMAVRATRSDTIVRTTQPQRIALPVIAPPAPEPLAPAAQVIAAPSRAAAFEVEPHRAASETHETARRSGALSPAQRRASARGTVVSHSAPSPAPAAAPAQPASVAAAAPVPTTAPAPAAPEVTAPTPEEAPPPRAQSTLTDETRLLWEADQALRSGNTSRAISLLDEHATRFPDGALSPERGAERVVALCKLGRIDAATVRSYLASHPNVSLSERIQQACSRILPRAK